MKIEKKEYMEPKTEVILVDASTLLAGSVQADIEEERDNDNEWNF